MKKLCSLLLTITLLAGLFWSCEKKGNPPALPPAGSMTIDFNEFIGIKKSALLTEGVKGIAAVENSNWTNAATVATIWNTILALNIAVPVASFELAVNKKPVYLDNRKWQWKYNVPVVGATYVARLTGQIRSSDIKWEMYISREGVGGFAEFLWFEGTSALNGKSGQWILNHSQQFQEPMLQIDWEVTGTELGNIRYTYIRVLKNDRSPDTFKDSYIEYSLTSGTLNASYTVHFDISGIANDFEDINIEWSTTAHNGRIKANYYYLDDLWHCWDGNGNDVTCN